jgi:hypothetical protein
MANRAEQSQFAVREMNANRRYAKGLGEKRMDYGCAKTKPICLGL